jgi:hypothetical protein
MGLLLPAVIAASENTRQIPQRVLGFRAFGLRGLPKVAGEWNLVCLALNLRRMAARGVQL